MMMMNNFHCACLAFLLAWSHACPAAEPAATPSGIPESAIAALQNDLAEAGTATSSAGKRRAYKNVFRDGEDLLEATPAAPNRWRVLGIMLDSRKYLFGMDKSGSNREALLEICAKLAEAPDEYAELRFEADMMLSEKALSDKKGATLEERAKALEAIIGRYRGTPAEAKSLMTASLLAPKLEAVELQKRILNTLGERFAGDPDVIKFRRQHLGFGFLDVLFAGTYTRADNVVLRFPADLMGRLSIMVFWSQKTPGFELYLKGIKEQQRLHPGRFEVFSFNLDELPDAGASTLRKMQLDWTVMRLPGGKKSQAFRTYARQDPVGVLVNAYGHTLLTTSLKDPAKQVKIGKDGVPLTMPALYRRLDNPRYFSQLQSLLVGDVLVTEPDGHLDAALPLELKMAPIGSDKEAVAKLARTAESVPVETLNAIQECFTPAPFRYRQTTAETLANFEKAEKLCREAVRQHPAAPDLWIVRNRRIIALLGMWNLACEPKHLEQAAREARDSLSTTLPPGADVVPRFCLAKEALRRGDTDPESVIQDLIEKTGGAEAPYSAHAAAAILALNANARDLYNRHYATLLAAPDGGSPVLWSMVSFLRDRICIRRLLKSNYIPGERDGVRGYMINFGGVPTTHSLPAIKLKTLDGRTLNLPQDTNGKLTMLVFVEPSTEPNAEFPIDADGKYIDTMKRGHNMLQYACILADKHINKDVTTIAAFLTEDVECINALMKTRELTCQAAIVPGGLANPMVRRLGVLSADRITNVFLLRRDGSIAWRASGLPYADSSEWINLMATKVRIEMLELETAYKALEKGDFKEAARVFGGPYLPWPPDRFGWRTSRYHGQALAYMGLKDWNAALESIETAVDSQKMRYYRKLRYDRGASGWRKAAATVTIDRPDESMAELWTLKAEVLDKLGRRVEAAQLRKRLEEPPNVDAPSIYKSFHERLKNWRLGNEKKVEKP
ncbi:MAG: hypothetical protein HQ567_11545 [Candidatus Nealsonbacteria bacterium]|nr:hypothetical protein [Candidatus Nealsonbacteria bacterium]